MSELTPNPRRIFSPRQSRAARALLNWSQDELASRCSLELEAIELFEAGEGELAFPERVRLGAALHAGGVVAVEAKIAGEGVRLAKASVQLYVG